MNQLTPDAQMHTTQNQMQCWDTRWAFYAHIINAKSIARSASLVLFKIQFQRQMAQANSTPTELMASEKHSST